MHSSWTRPWSAPCGSGDIELRTRRWLGANRRCAPPCLRPQRARRARRMERLMDPQFSLRCCACALVAVLLLACSKDAEPARPPAAASMGTEMPPGQYGAQPIPSAPAQRTAETELETAPGVEL